MKLKNKIFIGIGFFFLVMIGMAVYVRLLPKDTYQPLPAAHIIQKNNDPSLAQVVKSIGKTEFTDQDIRESFSKDIVNRDTINFFKSLQTRFSQSTDFESHYSEVCNYIRSKYPDGGKAERLCALYRKFTEYEVDLEDQLNSDGPPETAADALEFLKKQQDYRREYFGEEAADELYGAEVKAQEYSIRRSAIVKDTDLYGDAKMQMIKDLNREMWGDESDMLEQSTILNEPFNKYQESLAIYEKDMSEMNPAEKEEFIRKKQGDFFPEETVEKFRQLDAEKELEEEKIEEYCQREQEILNNPDIPEKGRDQKIRDLQAEIFGKEGASAFRRIQALEEAEKQ